jgi:FeS assembly SUF system regulator
MLRIGKLTDYAMLILAELATRPETVLSATSIAEVLQLPAPTVSKILKILADAEMVTSLRGAEGGYRLAREAKSISVADVITAMEGDLALTECCEKSDLCSINSVCNMSGNWRKINKMVHALLAKLSIIDMKEPINIKEINVEWANVQ